MTKIKKAKVLHTAYVARRLKRILGIKTMIRIQWDNTEGRLG